MIEFNPKGNSILDQELTVSGLEMNILPAAAPAALAFLGGGAAAGGAASILGGITAATGILSTGATIFGSINSAAAASRSASFQREQAAISAKHAKEVALRTNEYLKQQDKNDRANYELERNFAFDSLIKDWKYGKQIHKFEQLNRMQEFRKNKRLSKRQLRLNRKAEKYAIEQEQGVLNDAFMQNQFARTSNLSALKETLFEAGIAQQSNLASLNKAFFEGQMSLQQQNIRLEGIKDRQAYGQMAVQENINQMISETGIQKEAATVEGLIAQGQAELGQAGKSTEKGRQSTTLALMRSLRSLDNQLSGRYKQAAIQMAELNADASLQTSAVDLERQRTIGTMRFAQEEFGLNQQRLGGMMQFAQEEFAFNNAVLDANLDSAIEQAQRNIRDIMLDRKFSDLNVKASQMVRPSKLPYQPRPVLPPERIFLDRMQMVVPDAKIKTSADRFRDLVKDIEGKALATGGRPGEYRASEDKDEVSSPYLDDKGKLKKGYLKIFIKGEPYYQNSKTGKTYPA